MSHKVWREQDKTFTFFFLLLSSQGIFTGWLTRTAVASWEDPFFFSKKAGMHVCCHEFHSNVLNHKYPWTQRSNAFWQIFAWDYKSLELFEAFLLFWYWILKRLRWEREALSKVLKGTSSICPRFYFAASLHFAPSGFFCTRFSKFPTPKKFLKEILVLRSSQFKAW